MEVIDFEVYEVPPRWQFLKVETSTGLVGWGEPVVEGRAPSTRAAVEELMNQYILGEDPFPIEDHWQRMYRNGFYRGGPVLMSAIAGIDQALWDIKGKYFDVPVYELLGGKARDKVRLYQHIDPTLDNDDLAREAREQVEAGFTALKMPPTQELRRIDNPARVEEARERLRAVREAVGDEVDIALDFHGRATKPMAKRLAAELEEFDPMFYEEPVLPEHNDALATIASQTSIPIATGERMFSRWDFKQVFEDQTVDLIQPDVSHAGGITETKKIADMAEAYDVGVAPHSPLGPIALAACIQVDVCSPNAFIQEQVIHGVRERYQDVQRYVANPDVFDHQGTGYVDRPTTPGLGIEIDESYVEEMAGQVDYEIPEWRNDDGSITEW